MPGVIGGLAAVVVTGIANPVAYGESFADLFQNAVDVQWKLQLAALGTSLGFGLVGGLVFGVVTKYLLGRCMGLDPKHHYEDFEFFEVSPKHSHTTWQQELEEIKSASV
jgi:hypothetical protein